MSAIIFDFDGTIADSFDLVLEIFYEITGVKRFNEAEIAEFKKLPIRSAIKLVHLPAHQIPVLLIKGRARMGKKLSEIEPFPDMDNVLAQLHAQGHKLFIISTNSGNNVTTFLEQHRMAQNFEAIYGSVGMVGKSGMLKRVVRQKKLDPSDTYYVGDESRDVIAAKHARVHSVVSWGFNDVSLLVSEHPDAIMYKPQDLLTLGQ
jgi:phosphoglycolate phosphatase-like HAD superfamily hydrolase